MAHFAGDFAQSAAAGDWAGAYRVFTEQLAPGWFWRRAWAKITDALQALQPASAQRDEHATVPDAAHSAAATLYSAYLSLKVRADSSVQARRGSGVGLLGGQRCE